MTDTGAAAAFSGDPERLADADGTTDAVIVPLNFPATAPALEPAQAPISAPTTAPSTPASRWVGIAGITAILGSLLLTYYGTFMVGLFALATTIAVIGFMRATLPSSTMSWFSSRLRAIDCALYLGFALALLVLALGIPQ